MSSVGRSVSPAQRRAGGPRPHRRLGGLVRRGGEPLPARSNRETESVRFHINGPLRARICGYWTRVFGRIPKAGTTLTPQKRAPWGPWKRNCAGDVAFLKVNGCPPYKKGPFRAPLTNTSDANRSHFKTPVQPPPHQKRAPSGPFFIKDDYQSRGMLRLQPG
jgi:hypothetical protein